MPKPRGLKTKTAAIAFLVLLNFLTITEPARAGATGRAAAGDGDDKTAADATKDGSKSAATAASGAPGANAALVNELQQLKDTVQAQAQRLIEHTQELESERTALREELDRIAKLETALHVTPDISKGESRAAFATATLAAAEPPDAHLIRPPDAQAPEKQQVSITQVEHPLSFKIGAADFTPGGFADVTGVFRSTNTGTGLGTNFNKHPLQQHGAAVAVDRISRHLAGISSFSESGREYQRLDVGDRLRRIRLQRLSATQRGAEYQ